MSNHSSLQDDIINNCFLNKETQEKLREKEKEIQKELYKMFGATNKFPEGKLTPNDEGEILFGVTKYKGKVIINFNTPVTWLGMLPEQAKELARLLLKHVGGNINDRIRNI